MLATSPLQTLFIDVAPEILLIEKLLFEVKSVCTV